MYKKLSLNHCVYVAENIHFFFFFKVCPNNSVFSFLEFNDTKIYTRFVLYRVINPCLRFLLILLKKKSQF